jgi:hypothetical protein
MKITSMAFGMKMVEERSKVLIFTEGTILMHGSGAGRSREEIVEQVIGDEKSVREFEAYVPIGGAPSKLGKWKDQGCSILYLTSRTEPDEVEDIGHVLRRHDFPDGVLLFRREGEEYKDVVERVTPDILIEDDCESIGGVSEMTITRVEPEIRRKISSISVREFEGVDHLPEDLVQLMSMGRAST